MSEKARAMATSNYVRAPRLAEMLDISTRTLYRKVARGEFPSPIRIGKGSTRWRISDIEAFLAKAKRR